MAAGVSEYWYVARRTGLRAIRPHPRPWPGRL